MMMFGFGWLMMLLVVGLPLILILLLIAVAAGWLQNRNQSMPTLQNQAYSYQPMARTKPDAIPAERYCAHCGAGLQSDWTHCPQCGAPIQLI